jgi:hypothetical protein
MNKAEVIFNKLAKISDETKMVGAGAVPGAIMGLVGSLRRGSAKQIAVNTMLAGAATAGLTAGVNKVLKKK